MSSNIADSNNSCVGSDGSLGSDNPKKLLWSDGEDKKLADLYDQFKDKYDFKNIWFEIAKCIPGRTRDQCCKRWRYKLDPRTRRDKWTPEEEEMLWNLQIKHGNKWTKIGKMLKNRSDVEVKNHYYLLQRKIRSQEELFRCFEQVQHKNIALTPSHVSFGVTAQITPRVGSPPNDNSSHYSMESRTTFESISQNSYHSYPISPYFRSGREVDRSSDYSNFMDRVRPARLFISKSTPNDISNINTNGVVQTNQKNIERCGQNETEIFNNWNEFSVIEFLKEEAAAQLKKRRLDLVY